MRIGGVNHDEEITVAICGGCSKFRQINIECRARQIKRSASAVSRVGVCRCNREVRVCSSDGHIATLRQHHSLIGGSVRDCRAANADASASGQVGFLQDVLRSRRDKHNRIARQIEQRTCAALREAARQRRASGRVGASADLPCVTIFNGVAHSLTVGHAASRKGLIPIDSAAEGDSSCPGRCRDYLYAVGKRDHFNTSVLFRIKQDQECQSKQTRE